LLGGDNTATGSNHQLLLHWNRVLLKPPRLQCYTRTGRRLDWSCSRDLTLLLCYFAEIAIKATEQ